MCTSIYDSNQHIQKHVHYYNTIQYFGGNKKSTNFVNNNHKSIYWISLVALNILSNAFAKVRIVAAGAF